MPSALIAELRPNQPPYPVKEMRSSSMLRCNVMVQHDGTDDNVALPYL